jgi:hypothetical protein
MDTLIKNHRIWLENSQTGRSSMLERLSTRLDAKRLSLAKKFAESAGMTTFLASAGSGGSSEEEFAGFLGLLTEGY